MKKSLKSKKYLDFSKYYFFNCSFISFKLSLIEKTSDKISKANLTARATNG